MDKQCFQWVEKESFPYGESLKPGKQAIGNLIFKSGISTFTQFDPLKSVIVGDIDQTARLVQDWRILLNAYKHMFPEIMKYDQVGPFPQDYIQEARKNLNDYAQALQNLGIEVFRVGKMDFSEKFIINGVQTNGFCCFSPRDIPFTYYDSFYQFPTVDISRSKQFKAFQWIQMNLKKHGSKIYKAWQPKTVGFRYQQVKGQYIFQNQNEYFADAANLVKIGLDILFLISMAGSKGCYRKFKQLINEKYKGVVRVHPVEKNYLGYHIDTTYSIIGWNKKVSKYIVVANGNQSNPLNTPAIFRGKNWAILEVKEFDDQYFDENYNSCSRAIAMNFLTINPELVAISQNQIHLIKLLQFYGIKAIRIKNKHVLQFSGNMHCTSNDLIRQDSHGFGRILEKNPKDLSENQKAGFFDPQLLQILQQAGDIQDWVKICNQKKIYPTYLTQHLNAEQKQQIQNNNASIIIERN